MLTSFRKHLLYLVLSILLSSRFCDAQTATITVDANNKTGTVPKFIFGQNIEAWDSYQIFSGTHDYNGTKTGGGVWNPATRAPTVLGSEAASMGTTILRYPGGCLSHSFDWKKTIGPIANRPNYTFGLDEFIRYCNLIQATAMITISDYSGTAQDAADMVAYLNSPNDAAHPWGQLRAANGHPAPYQVKFFELGNESDHGNHDMQPPKVFNADQYSAYVNQYAAAMKAVDPTVQLGALMATGQLADDPWNDTVLTSTKNSINFVVVHRYAVGLNSPTTPVTASSDLLMRACMASGEQMDQMLNGFRTKILALTGRNIPLALTEYNALMVQPSTDQPVPYRFTLGAALFSADYLRVMMKPNSNVWNANYWQLGNGYWGAMKTDGTGVKKQVAYHVFKVWKDHFGPQLVGTTVSSPQLAFEGFLPRVFAASGSTYVPEVVGTTNVVPSSLLTPRTGTGYSTQVMADGSQTATFTNMTTAAYPMMAHFTGAAGQCYELSFEARATGSFANSRMGVGLQDSRGWSATQSAIGVDGAQDYSTWKTFRGRYSVKSDTTGVDLLWRMLPGSTPVNGTLEIRNLKVVQWTPERFPAYETVTATSSLSADGKKLYLVVFNKHHASAVNLTIKLQNFAALQGKRWTVTGPSLDSHNNTSQVIVPTESGYWPLTPGADLVYSAPARSMAAWEFTLTGSSP